jgi:hypothetical protein
VFELNDAVKKPTRPNQVAGVPEGAYYDITKKQYFVPYASGGSVIAHKGMTSNLKKQLKNK